MMREKRRGEALTDREMEAVEKTVQGLTRSQIAEEMNVSVSTLSSFLARAFQKTGAWGMEELSSWWSEHGEGERGRDR